MNTFGERLSNIRKARNLLSYELADKVGISHARMSNYERDRVQMDNETLVAVCKNLRVSSDYLLGLSTFPFDFNNDFSNEEVEFMLSALKIYNETKEKFKEERAPE